MSEPGPARNYLDENKLIWMDNAGGLHIDAPKLMKKFNIPNTPAGHRMLDTAIAAWGEKLEIPVTILHDLT